MGNICLAKVWKDSTEPFCEVEFQAAGLEACARTKFYVSDAQLLELADSLAQFARSAMDECLWSSGPDCTLRSFRKDRSMHIRMEAAIRVDDEESHVCKFYIDDIEAGALEGFANKIPQLKVGERISVY